MTTMTTMTHNKFIKCKFCDLENYKNKKLYQANNANRILYMGIIKNTEATYNYAYNNYHFKIYLDDERVICCRDDGNYFVESPTL
jgi:hypothetical protein